jgi:hypothetical protein
MASVSTQIRPASVCSDGRHDWPGQAANRRRRWLRLRSLRAPLMHGKLCDDSCGQDYVCIGAYQNDETPNRDSCCPAGDQLEAFVEQ